MSRQYTRRQFLQISAGTSFAAFLAACAGAASPAPSTGGASSAASPSSAASSAPSIKPVPSASPGPLNFLTWSDHWGKDEIKSVKGSTGIAVNVTELADNIDGFNKLNQVHGQLDVVSGDALWVPKYYDAGLIEAVDINSFKVATELYSMARSFTFWTKPDGYLAYPWGWSPIQIAFNPKFVTPAPDSWAVLIDPKYQGKIVMEKQPTDMMLFAGVATGAKDIYNMTDAELASAKDWLTKLKPNVLKLVKQNNETISSLASEEAWLGTQNLGSPDRVKKAGGPVIQAFVPKEGTTGFIDGEMTVKGGTNHDRVHAYIEAGATAEFVAQNFLDNGRPLWNEKAYQLLVDGGKKDQADRYLYNQPELALKMQLKGPSGNTDAYIKAWQEVFGA
jgi:spermidine/putrescine-binding protein